LQDDFRLKPDEITPNQVKVNKELRETAAAIEKPKEASLPKPVEGAEIGQRMGLGGVSGRERVKAFITRSAARRHLAQIAPEAYPGRWP